MAGMSEIPVGGGFAEKYSLIHHFLFSDELDYPERVGGVYFPLFTITVYLLIIKVLGPFIMRPFKPLKINGLLIAFNVGIVMWNGYISFSLFRHVYGAVRTGMLCNCRTNEANLKLFNSGLLLIWSFYLSKYADLLDTCFFILRKKQRQVSFLHVFHHSMVIIIVWGGLRFDSKGHHYTVSIALNSFVHVCTYTYYALSACGPRMQKILFPRKIYLTFVQIVQFWVILAYIMWSTVTGCESLDVWSSSVIIFLFTLMLLFANFYAHNYAKKKQ